MNLLGKCIFNGIGKHNGCNGDCYPSVLAYGINGNAGFYGTSRVPRKYRTAFFSGLPIQQDNPEAYAVAKAYTGDVLGFVDRGVGLYLYSVPNAVNRMGTGTGKTQTAISLGNEYTKARIVQHSKGEGQIEKQPTLFIRMAEFQNTYNKQFRGGFDDQQKASETFNKMCSQMEDAELLILDDISLRSSTEAMTNILYEIIDERDINEKPVIFTSNYPIDKIGEILSLQIQSRIEGMTEQIAFSGKDYRKGGIL